MRQEDSSPSNTSNSVLLAHPHALIRESIACILRENGFRVVIQIENQHGLYKTLNQLDPDIVLLDLAIVGVDVETIKELRVKTSASIAIMLEPDTNIPLSRFIEAGAKGCLSVKQSPQELVHALHLLARGDLVISAEIADGVKDLSICGDQSTSNRLSSQECKILCLIAQGWTNKEIAGELLVSHHTVKAYVRALLNKLNLRNRQQMVAYTIQEGLDTSAANEDWSTDNSQAPSFSENARLD
ncbi:MAG: response regulator transcription factor [Dehalococcoidia bacterium]|jgi:DNA-binding NarL/FixJ family response regulator